MIAARSVSGAARRLASSRAPAPVTVRSIASSRLPCRSPDSVRLSSRFAPGRGVDLHDAVFADRPWRMQARQAAALGQLDVVEQGAGGGDLRAAERAEAVEARDAEAPAPAGASRRRVEAAGRQRRDPLAPLAARVDRVEAAQHVVGNQQLGRLELGQSRGQRRGRLARVKNAPVDMSIQASPSLPAALDHGGEVVVAPGVEQGRPR